MSGNVIVNDRLFRTFQLENGPVTPITINNNLIDFTSRPTTRGKVASEVIRPKVAPWTVTSRVRTVAAAGRGRLVREGLPAGDDDFIVPGAASDGHYTLEQQHNFIRDIKACGRVAAARDPEMSFLPKVTPYSLRRGHISLRILAGEDIKRIADECGTSTAMIHRHISTSSTCATSCRRTSASTGRSGRRAAACVTCAWLERGERGASSAAPGRTVSACLGGDTLGCAWTRCSDRSSRAGTPVAVAKSSPRPVSVQYGRLARPRSGRECDTNLQVFCPLSSVGRALRVSAQHAPQGMPRGSRWQGRAGGNGPVPRRRSWLWRAGHVHAGHRAAHGGADVASTSPSGRRVRDDRMGRLVYPSRTRAELGSGLLHQGVAPERAWCARPPARIASTLSSSGSAAADHERAVGVLMSPACGDFQDYGRAPVETCFGVGALLRAAGRLAGATRPCCSQ